MAAERFLQFPFYRDFHTDFFEVQTGHSHGQAVITETERNSDKSYNL